MARQGWVVSKCGIFKVIVVDCEAPENKGQMEERGLLLDQNLKWAVGEQGWLIIQ